jgi:hypothetical protein
MGLSRKAWNNVVIFSMLLMIFFLNGFHHKLNPDEQNLSVQRLFPEQSFILAMAFPGYKIERIGTAWRINGPWQADNEMLKNTVNQWQATELEPANVSLSSEQAITVAQFWLAGHELPWSFHLYYDAKNYYLFDKQTQAWLSVSASMAQSLFTPIPLDKHD